VSLWTGPLPTFCLSKGDTCPQARAQARPGFGSQLQAVIPVVHTLYDYDEGFS
jgi:hypothetical protein